MSMHPEEMAFHVAPGALAVLLLDQAGWHGTAELVVPTNITLTPRPPRCLELYPVKNVWQLMHDNWLSNRIVKSCDDIVDHCCFAWNKLVDQPWRIMSVGVRPLGSWALINAPWYSRAILTKSPPKCRYYIVDFATANVKFEPFCSCLSL
jgi:hypothetical protein